MYIHNIFYYFKLRYHTICTTTINLHSQNFTSYNINYPNSLTKSYSNTMLCKYTTCKDPPKKSAWKKLTGHSNTLLDIVSRSRMDQKGGKSQPKTKEEDFRTRRRRLYRLMTEEKPTFPLQHRNFYSHVMENKEVVKTLSLLSTCTQNMKQVRIFNYCITIIIK